jgi:hypothetical protein
MAASQHGFSKSSASGLPVPSVTLADMRDGAYAAYNPNGVNYTVSANGDKLYMERMPLFTANEIPQELFSQDLRLEVLWYTKKSLRARGGGGGKYVHPKHTAGIAHENPTGGAPVAAQLPNSRSRGGNRSGFNGHTTEWSVTKIGQRFFIDSLGLFFLRAGINYVDVTGNANSVTAYVPANVSANGGYSPNPNGFGYSAKFRPNYFKFRFSIQDPNDPRARITGAETDTFVMSSSVMPFMQDAAASQAVGQMRRRISSFYQPDQLSTWLKTRLPSN